MSKHRSRFTLGFLLGAAVGAAAGVLAAPRSGRSTRQRLQSTLQSTLQKSAAHLPGAIEQLSQEMRDRAGSLSEKARDRWGPRLERLREAIATGVAATQSAPDHPDRMTEGSEDLAKTAASSAAKPRQLAYNRIATSAAPLGDR